MLTSRLSGPGAKLFSNAALPYGKRVHANVALAGLDTTRSAGASLLSEEAWTNWATGELPDEDLDKVKEFFDQNKDARHRVVLMHHYPFDDFEPASPSFPMHFVEPDADTVRNWLSWAGATLVLCGHIHDDRGLRRAPGST